MEGIRESKILIQSPDFKESETKFSFVYRLDFGTSKCEERKARIKAFGVEPSTGVTVITHEFATEDAAQKMVVAVEALKPMLPIAPLLEVLKAEGKLVVLGVRLPPKVAELSEVLKMVAGSMGDFTKTNQHIQLTIATGKTINEIVHNPAESVLAAALEQFCFKLELFAHKDLAVEVAKGISMMAPEHARKEIVTVGQYVSSFHHLNLEIALSEVDEKMKTLYKEEIVEVLKKGAAGAMGMIGAFNLGEVLSNGGQKTTVLLCFDPMISAEITLDAPTCYAALEKFATL